MSNPITEPIFPSSGTKYTAAFDIAGLGGDTSFLRGRLEGTWYLPVTPRTSFGFRLQGEYAVSYTHLRAKATVLDIVCRLLLEQN